MSDADFRRLEEIYHTWESQNLIDAENVPWLLEQLSAAQQTITSLNKSCTVTTNALLAASGAIDRLHDIATGGLMETGEIHVVINQARQKIEAALAV